MILPKYADMRARFAVRATNVTHAADNGAGLVRLTVGSTVPLLGLLLTPLPILVQDVGGTVEANGPWTSPVLVDGTHVDLPEAFANAYTAGGSIFLLDPDGFPAWPGPKVFSGPKAGSFDNTGATGLLRAGGFASSWTVTTAGGTLWSPAIVGAIGPLIAGPVPGGDPLFPLTITCNGGAPDSGASVFDWYLSQRSDALRYILADGTLGPPQPQYFALVHPDATHSGTVVLTTQAPQISALFPGSGGVPPTDAASLATLFAQCGLYVSSVVASGAYQWARFTP